MTLNFAVNLKDIAEQAGVSVSTVSRVVKKKGEIAPETRERILKIAKEMGYHDNRLSKAIRTGKTGLIGVMMDYSKGFFGQVACKLEQALLEQDFLPIFLSFSGKKPDFLFHRLVEQRVDGMILVPILDSAGNDCYQEFNRCGIPIVTIDRETPADVCFVGTDDFLGGWKNADYFYQLGHRQLGYYSGPQKASSAALRKKGFFEFCQSHADCRFYQLGSEKWGMDSDAFIREQLEAHPKLTCAGCFYDAYAVQVCRVLRQMGRNVPGDFSVSGFGNVDYEYFDEPFLTTYDQKPALIAQTAAECLCKMIRSSQRCTEKIRLESELIIRNSTRNINP